MAKIFETDAEIVDLAETVYGETGLAQMGFTLKVMSVTKSKDLLKVSKANATTEFLVNDTDIITLYVYEDAFKRLGEDYMRVLMEGAFSNVYYDTEKEKLMIDNTRYGEFIRMRRKYPTYGDIIETSVAVMEEIEQEEKQRKEAEKENKSKKNRA